MALLAYKQIVCMWVAVTLVNMQCLALNAVLVSMTSYKWCASCAAGRAMCLVELDQVNQSLAEDRPEGGKWPLLYPKLKCIPCWPGQCLGILQTSESLQIPDWQAAENL